MATTLPVALGKLQEEGRIRRIATNGRLDQQRYRYVRWDPNPLAGFPLSADEAQTELARRYFTWIVIFPQRAPLRSIGALFAGS